MSVAAIHLELVARSNTAFFPVCVGNDEINFLGAFKQWQSGQKKVLIVGVSVLAFFLLAKAR